ncbi:cytochrome P450 [Aspergillus pseudodeflectus]|uniref:Cytochrome P450 n=1 Tax=Aspergillus pseudodeflectus TaxID=176178 RepID=A0ABR4KHJ1_9EURO
MGLREQLVSQLTVTNVILSFAAYVALKFLYQIIYCRFFHPLSVFPGPFWGSVTRLWIAWHNMNETELPTVYALTKKYGPVVRITPSLLLVSDPTKLPEIYHRNADKTGHYITGSFGETESLFNMRSHKTHAAFRKHAAGPYSFSSVKRMEPLIDLRIRHWVNKLDERFVRTGAVFDFPGGHYMAYDIISEVGFGAPFGFVEKGEDVGGLIQGFHDGLSAFGLLARLHPFTSWVKTTFLKRYLVAKPEDDSGIGVLMRFRDSLIERRLEELKQNKDIGRIDLLQTFLEARTEDGQPLTMDYIKAEILLVLLAGADTTGTVFQAMIHYLLTHQEVYERMMEEVDTAVRKGLISADTPQYTEVLEHLPFFVACVRETLRMCPPAPNIFPRYVSEPGLDLYGKIAPPGTEVSGNPWIMQRDEKVFGENAEEFNPDRWMNPESAKLMNKYLFSFGYGARGCLGRDIAMMELFKGPLQFFRHYKPHSVKGKSEAKFVVKGGIGYWRGMWLTIEKRPLVTPL